MYCRYHYLRREGLVGQRVFHKEEVEHAHSHTDTHVEPPVHCMTLTLHTATCMVYVC